MNNFTKAPAKKSLCTTTIGASTRQSLLGLAVGLTLTCISASATAAISFVDLFRSNTFVQTGNGNTVSANGSFFAARLHSSAADEFASATMTYSGVASPATLLPIDANTLNVASGLYPTQAAMDTDYPTGNYQFDAGAFTTTVVYSADDYPQSTPYLTGTDFDDLQGVDPNAAFALHFNPFVTGASATESVIFFSILDTTLNASVFDAPFLAASTTGLTLPGGSLIGGHTYTYELLYSNRDQVPSPGADNAGVLGFDFRTSGTFFAAQVTTVPAPAPLALLGIGLFGSIASTWRRRRQAQAVGSLLRTS